MRRILPFLLFAVVAFAGCQSAKAPEEYAVKDADFGTWTEFVARWNGDMPGITGIGKPDQPDSEWQLHRPVWHAEQSMYLVDFGHGTSLHAIMKNGRVTILRLIFGPDGDSAGAGRLTQGIEKAVVVVGAVAQWNEASVQHVTAELLKSRPQTFTSTAGEYAFNFVNDARMGQIVEIGRK